MRTRVAPYGLSTRITRLTATTGEEGDALGGHVPVVDEDALPAYLVSRGATLKWTANPRARTRSGRYPRSTLSEHRRCSGCGSTRHLPATLVLARPLA
jgi:hypothetical protein